MIRFGILRGLSQTTGGMAFNRVEQRNGYGNTDAHSEQRSATLQKLQLEPYRKGQSMLGADTKSS
jgi:hypothetical protein